MPKLQDLREIKKISLPSYPNSQIEIYDSLLVNQLKSIEYNNANSFESLITMLPQIIKSWNFTGDNDEILPITAENLGLIKQSDLHFLLNEITNFNSEIKKKQGT